MHDNMNKSAMLKGLIIGAFMSLNFISGVLGLGFFVGLIILGLTIYFVYKFAKTYRINELNDVITYNQAFFYIFLVYFYGSIIAILTVYIYTAFIQPDYLSIVFDEVLKFYDAINFPIDDKMIDFIDTIKKPTNYALINIGSGVISSAFWGLILAAFVKKEKSIFEQ